jgi:hypothetical protein
MGDSKILSNILKRTQTLQQSKGSVYAKSDKQATEEQIYRYRQQ